MGSLTGYLVIGALAVAVIAVLVVWVVKRRSHSGGDMSNREAAEMAAFLGVSTENVRRIERVGGHPQLGASMQCDICDKPGQGTVVRAKTFSAAVVKGFDPFKEGLAADPLGGATLLGKTTAESWRDDSISGFKSMSDWNVCSRCMTVLRTYL